MQIEIVSGDPALVETAALVVGVFEESAGQPPWTVAVNRLLGGAVAARLKQDIEVEAKDGLTGEVIRVKTLDGQIASIEPKTAIAWFGQKKGADGKWVSAGCFKQGFFVNEANLQKWLEARPAMTGRQITIAQALADKMKLSPEQIAKACKLGECK